MDPRVTATAALLAATALLGLAPQAQAAPAAPVPQPQAATAEVRAAASEAAGAPAALATLSRFFAREGRVSAAAAQPRIEGEAVPVHHLSPEFVAGKAGAPVARLEFLASKAVSSDGQQAALWTARTEAGWQVVNIATGDDEFRYAQLGAARLPGGTVFREPQIDAWYVAGGAQVLPLDEDAVQAVGAGGTTLAAYRARVAADYGDKLPGSAYDRRGTAGGFAEPGPQDTGRDTGPPAPLLAGGAGALALGGAGLLVLRRRRAAAPGGPA
ncbi:LPXTG cell wall anchor domain-containing protein [Streptomyces sp. cmx-4-9]|uniref:LPXTG cell wall anchor domain-containing protein n=1 Tax=Streptomyces sp. cmx-4-9 TaxID=2790941 RepID=UPI00397F0010